MGYLEVSLSTEATYGHDSKWVSNVVAEGGREVETLRLLHPPLVHDDRRDLMLGVLRACRES
jgi:hypothetical protein